MRQLSSLQDSGCCFDSTGGAQVFRQSAYLSGRVQSLLLLAAPAVVDPVGRQSRPGSQPSLPALRLLTRRLSSAVSPDDLRQHHAQVQAATSTGHRSRDGRTQHIHSPEHMQRLICAEIYFTITVV